MLVGCSITFSGVIPLEAKNPHSNQLWQFALALGANVTRELIPNSTTHLVAMSPLTEKAHRARNYPNIKIVKPLWLQLCYYHVVRKCEDDFALVAKRSSTQRNNKVTTTMLHMPSKQCLPFSIIKQGALYGGPLQENTENACKSETLVVAESPRMAEATS